MHGGSLHKMALKDWKKSGKSFWMKKNNEISLIRDETKNKITYEIDIYIFDSHHITKKFKLKSSAIKYAKQYMRKH